MTSAHRYPPPQTSSQNDFRLPSLKDLNFAYRPPVSGPQPALPPSQSTELGVIQQEHPQTTNRHPAAWGRTAVNGSTTAPSSVAGAHQQHASPQSAGHDVPSKVDYASKHENGGYAHPGIPLSAQATPVPGSVNTRNENASHSPNQPKRQRTTSSSTNMPASRDVRPSHPNGYPPPQYASYPPASQPQQQSPYHPVQQNLPAPPPHAPQSAPPPHGQVQHPPPPMPVTAHNGYPSYQHAYVQPRQTLLHPQNSPHPPPPQQSHSNPYPSSGPPSAPPPQGPWAQSHQPQPQPQHQHHHQPPPPPHHQQTAPPQPPPPQAPPPQHVHQQHPSHAAPPHHHHQQQHQPPQHQHHQQHHQPHQPPPTTIPPSSMHNIPPPQPAPPPPPPAHAHTPHHQTPVQPQQPPQYAQHQSYPQQQQQPPPPPQSFHRPTTIAPTALESRPVYTPAPPEPPRAPSVQNDAMAEITNHCTVLHNFAHRYASLQQTMPHAQPAVSELEEMSHRALAVVRLLQDFREITLPGDIPAPQAQTISSQNTPEESRPPKRPWEDVSQEEGASGPDANDFQDQFPANPPPTSEGKQTTAEQDMELIRTKRATSTAVANGSAGQPKSKYRKRSSEKRASPPGKCHSCNIRETPEWRRGPDGARTLCNACGLHYAKLMRKQSKAANGDAPPIDLETLRASARAADIADKASRSTKPQSSSKASAQQSSASPDSPMDTGAPSSHQAPPSKPNGIQQPQPAPTGTHQGSFQVLMSGASEHPQPPQPPPPQNQSQPAASSSSAMQVDSRPSQQTPTPQMQHQQHVAPPPPHHAHPSAMGMPPPPPWPTTARGSYGPAPEHIQHAHQSFMRGSAQQASR